MTSTPLPRLWYLSLTLVWGDHKPGFDALDKQLGQFEAEGKLIYPSHQILIPAKSRHSTAFAILRINGTPCADMSLRAFAEELLKQLATDKTRADVTEAWRETVSTAGLSLKACQLRAFDDGTTIQFCDSEALASFRDKVRHALTMPVHNLVSSCAGGLVEPLLNHSNKSRGAKVFGFIARSPCRSDQSELRWEMPLQPPVTFQFKQIHLLSSDDALTNPRKLNEEDIVFV